jgi:hypothetical protein
MLLVYRKIYLQSFILLNNQHSILVLILPLNSPIDRFTSFSMLFTGCNASQSSLAITSRRVVALKIEQKFDFIYVTFCARVVENKSLTVSIDVHSLLSKPLNTFSMVV